MSGESWRLTALASRAVVEAALEAQEQHARWDDSIVLAASEVAEDRPDDWRLDAYLPRKPDADDWALLTALLGPDGPCFSVERLPDADWVTESQRGLEPVEAGRFRVRTPEHPATADPAVRELIIPAAQAFGTGQHATTAGCLAMLDRMERAGIHPRNIVDVGTGTGLLAFGALHLWPDAMIAASDIDPVCAEVLRDNAALNRVRLGTGPGEVSLMIAAGMDDPVLTERAPYDLIIANILAKPLIELAAEFADHLAAAGELVLSGLLTSQQAEVVNAYEGHACQLIEAAAMGDWAILRLRKCADPAD